MTDVILVVNSGSSSIKFALYSVQGQALLLKGKVAGIGRKPELTASLGTEALVVTDPFKHIPTDATPEWLITQLLERLRSKYVTFNPVAVGHRVVHGGSEFTEATLITPHVRAALENLIPLAPLHQPHSLTAIDAIAKVSADLPQVTCFDTSFHCTQDRLEQLFALPRTLTDAGIIRYGFHGLSYQYIAAALPEHLGAKAEGRIIVAHLGNGASLCAMKERRSVASTMGFSTLDGLVMGSRCGSLDAGVVLYLQQQKGMSADEIQHLLYRKSGLLGVSGISNNMQVLAESSAPEAREAIALFCHQAVREIGTLVATLGGLDALVFTAGIGENSELIRCLICESLAWLGLELDNEANAAGLSKISTPQSVIDVCIIPTDEEAVIAASTCQLIATLKI